MEAATKRQTTREKMKKNIDDDCKHEKKEPEKNVLSVKIRVDEQQ